MVNPKIMCRQHLLGEHVEIHMFIGTLNQEKSVKGYLEKGLLEVHNLYFRHQKLVEEMKRRGYNHCSEVESEWKFAEKLGVVNIEKNLEELINRCPICKKRYFESKNQLKIS
ncbi:MAG: pyrimidine dimer DNA glycosylase/endonuclease V [Candidatus Bathyarchaeum tardum]|nr:MAG: pyrimidine dimer DNA glycosylase/endonuclease V [Candidatus Bathyarchaeum tardum]